MSQTLFQMSVSIQNNKNTNQEEGNFVLDVDTGESKAKNAWDCTCNSVNNF